ncbi:hypothetical protein [Microbacterium sp. NPDC058389]|uniref:hypothetical protein n=1 Tax=Microbacterium sp. NPDC058389 TaxID=3346475 RepID=UPI0036563F47
MAATSKPKAPRIADVLGELVAELRLANRLRALSLGTSALEHDAGPRSTTDAARARLDRRNALRADVRQALGLDDEEADRG